jgi:hypothetical protein
MFALPRRLMVGDVSVIHLQAASFAGGHWGCCMHPRVYGRCPGRLQAACVSAGVLALPFVPMSVESFGRLGVPALTLLATWLTRRCRLASLASLVPPSTRGRFESLAWTVTSGSTMISSGSLRSSRGSATDSPLPNNPKAMAKTKPSTRRSSPSCACTAGPVHSPRLGLHRPVRGVGLQQNDPFGAWLHPLLPRSWVPWYP